MRAARLRSAVITLPLLALAVGSSAVAHAGTPASAPATTAASSLQRLPAAPVTLLAGPRSTRPTLVAPDRARTASPDSVSATTAAGAQFTVTYSGFSPAARTAFQRAVDLWAATVQSSVPITVKASFTPLGRGVLGSAGPSGVYKNFSGAPQRETWYVDAIANKRAGRQLDPSPDIVAEFNSSFSNWHFGSAAAPQGTYDFTSIVLHELGHGLGFLGAGYVAGGVGTVRESGSPISYDRFTENGAGKALPTFADRSAALKTQLTGGNLFFDSPAVRDANSARPARLYAPATWQDGSSYSHLAEGTYRAGNRNSLMTPFLSDGETIRSPGPITKAILTTIGW